MIVKGKVQRFVIPHELGHWFEFRMLSWSELEDAGLEYQRKALHRFVSADTDDLKALADIRGVGDDDETSEATKKAQALAAETAYDKTYMISQCLVAWSYTDELTAENIADLDPKTAEWAFTTALSFCKRTSAEGEASSAE